MIRVKPRANIEDGFVEAVKKIGRSYIIDFKMQSPQRKRNTMSTSGVKVAHAIDLLKADGIDKLKTKLRSMPFEKFTFEVSPMGKEFIIGYTNPIESVTYHGNRKLADIYKMGKYRICIPVEAFRSGSSNTFHLVPDENPYTKDRTPHHYTYGSDDSSISYLDYSPEFCWSGFASIVSATLNSMDIAELFRSLYLYISVINMNSLYTRNSWHEDRLWDKEKVYA